MNLNTEDRHKWSSRREVNIQAGIHSCAGYLGTPGWSFIRSAVIKTFSGFSGLRVAELGCGQGKMSLIFALLGAHTTLVDYNRVQLEAAGALHGYFQLNPELLEGDILNLPEDQKDEYNVAMSFGTLEHFWGDQRQQVFRSYASTLRPGGLTIIWVPNKWGVLFHLGNRTRRMLNREVCPVDETPYTRRELRQKLEIAGFEDIRIIGAEYLINDFHNFIIKVPSLKKRAYEPDIYNPEDVKRDLIHYAMTNEAAPGVVGNYFSYPLLAIARKVSV